MCKNSKFKTLIKYDIMHGTFEQWKFFIFAIIIFLSINFFFFMSVQNVFNGKEHAYFIDYLMNMFFGIAPFKNDGKNVFIIPIVWLLFNSFLGIINGFYITKDLKKNATAYLIRIKSRKLWWTSKFVWCIFSTIVYYFLFVVSIVIIMGISGCFDFGTNAAVCENFFGVSFNFIDITQLYIASLFVPLIISTGVSALQIMLTLFIKPIYVFIGLLGLLVTSVYFYSPMLVYNYSMVARNNILDGVDISSTLQGIIIGCGLMVSAFIVGMIKIKRKDIL